MEELINYYFDINECQLCGSAIINLSDDKKYCPGLSAKKHKYSRYTHFFIDKNPIDGIILQLCTEKFVIRLYYDKVECIKNKHEEYFETDIYMSTAISKENFSLNDFKNIISKLDIIYDLE
ncbi:MAG: hypothetical protein LC122_12060 [Chitinophagales bacterium]|nr:hypothetical protein [Chitinophagales bacterium]